MKIQEILIERFGVWRDLSLTLPTEGPCVFYGPNEAGKTTLLRFVRGVLYGFPETADCVRDRTSGAHSSHARSGALRVEHRGRRCEIRRASKGSTAGLVTVAGLDRDAQSDDLLSELLTHTNEAVFRNVFAISLNELQELSTLQSDEVARHLYGWTLGPDGRSLLDATRLIDQRRSALFDESTESGLLIDTISRHTTLSQEIHALDARRCEHAALLDERSRQQAYIDKAKARKTTLHIQLRGHLFLERVVTPWTQSREYQAEFDTLPRITGFPKDGIERLRKVETELATARSCRRNLMKEVAGMRREITAIDLDPELRKHAATVQGFIDQRDWMQERQQKVTEGEKRVARLKARLDAKRAELGEEWTTERLQSIDCGPDAHFRLLSQARSYRTILSRKKRLHGQVERLTSTCRKQSTEGNEKLQSLGIDSLDEALETTRKQIVDLEDLGRLKLRDAELEQRRIGIEEQLDRLETRINLPHWVYGVLGFFGVSGLMFMLLGMVTGVTTSGLAGMMYLLLGSTSCGLAWKLKSHFEGEVRGAIDRLQGELRQNESRANETRQILIRLTAVSTRHASPDKQTTTNPAFVSEADLIAEITHRLSELQRLREDREQTKTDRGRLADLRERFQTVQRETATARQAWCDVLLQLGLSESVRIEEAFEGWQKVVEAHDRWRVWNAAEEDLTRDRQTWNSFRQRIEVLGRRIDRWNFDYAKPLDVLTAWSSELKAFGQKRAEIRRLRREIKTRRREARGYRERIEEFKLQHSALLMQAGAATPDEFEQRAAKLTRREELAELLALAEEDLASACRNEPDLAIVESNLLAFDVEENTERIELINLELEELDELLLGHHEQLGQLKQQIADLEADGTTSSLRFDRAQVAAQLLKQRQRWQGLQRAANVVGRMKRKYERTCQPAILAATGEFLKPLTDGRFANVWTPLGERDLLVDDEQGRTYSLDELSGGTREQLLLATRLAVISDLSRRGVELPIVLDDVLVNFDEPRTNAAIDTLLGMANEHQQMLFFTCHRHLAKRFSKKGVETIELPEHQAALEERRAG
jgi:uncharacterized protein YhaN